MRNSSWRIGADIGGTFTDIVLENGDRQHTLKILTTPAAPEEAVLEGIGKVCSTAGIALSEVSSIIHGTTLATNSLIERRGAKTALITTEGFRDVIEMRTESRFEQYDLNLVLPEALIERQHRLVVHERVDAMGRVLRPLTQKEVDRIVQVVEDGAYESVAIGFLHSYLNDSHERMVAFALREAMPELSISLSSEVSPQMREYERFNTTCANAYVKPMMERYLARLQERVREMGSTAPIYLMHSGGGIVSIESASQFPVRLVESGPAGGAIFAADLATRHGLKRVLSFDMGGTTAKICLIKEQSPKTARVFEVARSYRFKKGSGMPISIPVIDMVEIGAGGGSLANIDSMNQIRVGPQSAGSDPGPACYDRGGEQPAVTDADLLLGRLDADEFAGGTIRLSTEKAKHAVLSVIGKPLNLPAPAAAFGIAEVVDENMANAARMHGVENGEDLATYTMIAFGGAAPIHAARLCQKLGIDRFLVPPGAGVGSAIGFLRAPFSFETTRSLYVKLSAFHGSTIHDLLAEMSKDATAFVRECDPDSDIEREVRAYMRYIGQGWEIPVDLPASFMDRPDHDAIKTLFEQAYEKLFGRIVHGLDIEITGWAVKALTVMPPIEASPPVKRTDIAESLGSRRMFDPQLQTEVDAAIVARGHLRAGVGIDGPAVITEAETSVIVPPGFAAVMLQDGTIDIHRQR